MQRKPQLPLDTVRKLVGVAFDGTAIISRPSYASDGMGGGTETFSALGTVRCLVASDGRPRELTVAGEVQSVIPWTVDVPYDTDVQTQDRIASGSYSFEVVGVDAGRTQRTYCRATCVRMQS